MVGKFRGTIRGARYFFIVIFLAGAVAGWTVAQFPRIGWLALAGLILPCGFATYLAVAYQKIGGEALRTPPPSDPREAQ